MRRESLLLTSYSSTGLPKVLVLVYVSKKQHPCDEGSKGGSRRAGAVSPYFCWTGLHGRNSIPLLSVNAVRGPALVGGLLRRRFVSLVNFELLGVVDGLRQLHQLSHDRRPVYRRLSGVREGLVL